MYVTYLCNLFIINKKVPIENVENTFTITNGGSKTYSLNLSKIIYNLSMTKYGRPCYDRSISILGLENMNSYLRFARPIDSFGPKLQVRTVHLRPWSDKSENNTAGDISNSVRPAIGQSSKYE